MTEFISSGSCEVNRTELMNAIESVKNEIDLFVSESEGPYLCHEFKLVFSEKRQKIVFKPNSDIESKPKAIRRRVDYLNGIFTSLITIKRTVDAYS